MVRLRKNENIMQTRAEALVNPVNCAGVMGAGLALQVKRAFPENFQAYAAACSRGELQRGRVLLHDRGKNAGSPRYIVNFPTKGHWRDKSALQDIEAGMADLVQAVNRHGIQSVAIPKLGCGLGGLSWEDVQPLILAAFSSARGLSAVQVHVYI